MSQAATKIPLTEAAVEYGCSVRTIRRMIARGELTGYRVGQRLLRVDRAELASAMRVVQTVAAS
jgi:excisionase family DNA binding protein